MTLLGFSAIIELVFRVPVPPGRLSADDTPRLQENFDHAYERMCKRLNPDVDVEGLNWRVIVAGPRPTIQLAPAVVLQAPAKAARTGEPRAFFPETSGYLECPVYDRYQLAPGMVLRSPAIIEERESTVVVSPGARVEVDAYQHVVIWLPV